MLGASLAAAGAHADEPAIRVTAQPAPIYKETTTTGQAVNCDFVVENLSGEAWQLQAIELSVYDAARKLEIRKLVNDNGNSPGIATLNEREVGPGQRLLIFNPFASFSPDLELATLAYRFSWTSKTGSRALQTPLMLQPQAYAPKAALRLPVRGRLIVWDGHDFYAHHRRFNYLARAAQADGSRSNPDRYAYDFVPVDPAGDMLMGDPALNASWFGFGQPVYAAGAGRVIAVSDDSPDNRDVDMARFKANRLADYGNHILVEHGGGEYALYGHLRQGSATVKAGQSVHQGERIAALGASGSALMPHLHFQLQTTSNADGEGLPSRFDSFRRLLGQRSVPVSRGPIDSGDIVEDGGEPTLDRSAARENP